MIASALPIPKCAARELGPQLPSANPSSPIPLYLQATSILAESIERGDFLPGQQLPNTTEIARQLRVSLLTAHRALNSLAQQGWLLRGQGQCTIVRPDFRSAVARKSRHTIALAFRPDATDNPHSQALLAKTVSAAASLAPNTTCIVCGYPSRAQLDSMKADGVLFVCPDSSDLPLLEEIASSRPVVVLGPSERWRGVTERIAPIDEEPQRAVGRLRRLLDRNRTSAASERHGATESIKPRIKSRTASLKPEKAWPR